jgi:EAL domain-containing protein (putative c-di-GMP-specific phosphodiesterase class I)
MAEALRLGVIAEGVETSSEVQALLALGCDYAQGFHLAHPLPAEQLVSECFS